MNRRSTELLNAPIGPTLTRLTVPMIVGIVTILLFGLVDTYFISLLGTHELAAIGFTLPVSFVVMNVAMGLGTGTASVLARILGQGDAHRAKRVTTDSLLLSTLIVLLVAGAGLATIDRLFPALGATPQIMPYIHEYMTLWYAGVAFLVIPMVGNSAIRATGDTKTPSIIMIIAGAVNGVLDPLLIFGLGPFPELGVTGAALATVISWLFAFLAALWVLHARKRLLDLKPPPPAALWASWRIVLAIGLPAAGTNIFTPIATAVVTRMVADYGPAAVAAFGVGSRIESIVMVAIFSLAAVFPGFVGQNFGAGNMDRIQQAVSISLRFSLVFQGGVYLLLALAAPGVAMLFSDDPRVIDVLQSFLWILPLSYGAFGMVLVTAATFNALHKPLQATLVSLMRLFVFYLPLAYLGASVYGLTGLFIGCAAANLLSGLLAWIRIKSHLAARMAQPTAWNTPAKPTHSA